MGDRRKGQADEDGPEKLLERLVGEAPEHSSEYARDVRRLFEMIKVGGPDNCASSLLYEYLATRYPSEYAALKESWADNGGILCEGFDHVFTPTAEEARSLNIREDVVFCLDGEDYGQEGYMFFMHEADVLLMALASKVENGEMDSLEARRMWLPYRKWFPPLYDSDEWEAYARKIELATWRPGMPDPMENNPLEETGFPPASMEYLPASDAFALYADNLGLPDVGFLGAWSGSTGEIFEVASEEALRSLTAKVAGEYRLVVCKDLIEYDFTGSSNGPSDALSCLERTLLDRDGGAQ